VAERLKNRDIAEKLGIDQHVVRNYLGVIYEKIGLSNRVELALWYEARVHEGKLPRRLHCESFVCQEVLSSCPPRYISDRRGCLSINPTG
jgi:hypothetical protein